MAFLSLNLGFTISKATASSTPIIGTFTATELIPSISDPYFSDISKWKKVTFEYQNYTSSQYHLLTFYNDSLNNFSQATFNFNYTAFTGTWNLAKITIMDWDNKFYNIELGLSTYDISLVS